ncbi:three-helix bundle dimerization domain-containing protein [Nocardia sp. NPDC088792]|uniref:three-helix bundle dimerization domain-containing protein n=1 Tax=Nocardia sp. NPDC088792 TaxID=3364332 RepID=UPI0038059B1A
MTAQAELTARTSELIGPNLADNTRGPSGRRSTALCSPAQSEDHCLVLNDEATQIQSVLEKLTRHHPEISPSAIAAIVDRSRDALAGARVRNFVPLLVERRANIELAASRTR